MTFEVYTGARPGRPRLALVLAAAALALTLGLAWQQVRQRSALGPEQRVGDTPLRVRLPAGWQADPEDPQAFILPVREEGWRRQHLRYERRIRLEFERLGWFQPLEDLLRSGSLGDARRVSEARPARLGSYDALELDRFVPVRLGRRTLMRETIVRLTCLPRGQLVTVTYDPLIELRPSDREIVDDICRSLRIEDPTLVGPPDEFLRAAGLRLELDPGWRLVGAEFPEVAGVHVGGSVDGLPAWSIAIFRTWLAASRTPDDLLVDFAADRWLLLDVADRIERFAGADGAAVAALRHPDLGRTGATIQSAWTVKRTETQVAILFVQAGPRHAAAAEEAAARIAQSLRILPLEVFDALPQAEEAGRRLAAKLRERGAVPRWGRGAAQAQYRGRAPGGPFRVRVSREARGRNAERGYEGLMVVQTESRREEITRWTLDGRAEAYEWRADLFRGSVQVSALETRAAADAAVIRELTIGHPPPVRRSFQPGPAFVPPPAESVVEGWVAGGQPPAAVVHYSALLGPATRAVLLRKLPPDGAYPRVLIQEDHWPEGLIEAFDEQHAELQYVAWPGMELERIPPAGGT